MLLMSSMVWFGVGMVVLILTCEVGWLLCCLGFSSLLRLLWVGVD